MANKILWDSNPSPTTLLSTELNSLANDGRVLSDVIDNSTELNTLIDFEMYIDNQGSARSTGAVMDLYMLTSLDGTNYPGDATKDPSVNNMVGSFAFDATTSASYDTIKGISLEPGKHKVVLKNRTGQALASSGNTLKYRTYCFEVQ